MLAKLANSGREPRAHMPLNVHSTRKRRRQLKAMYWSSDDEAPGDMCESGGDKSSISSEDERRERRHRARQAARAGRIMGTGRERIQVVRDREDTVEVRRL